MSGSGRVPAEIGWRLIACFVAVLAMAASILACNGSQEPPNPHATDVRPVSTDPAPTLISSSGTSGITDDSVLFGQSAAFSGPAEALGINMRLGIEAAFAEANGNGGVHGRELRLESLDDKYEPEDAATNTRSLIRDSGVFALIGEVGTPTSRSATPVAAEEGAPFIAPFTGAAFLRDTNQFSNIINLRASYNDETEEMVKRFTTDLGIERIAVLYQDDSFGRAGYNGTLAALRKRDIKLVAEGLYPRNTTAVKTALLDLGRARPDGIIMVGAYEPIGTFIQWARLTNLVNAKFIIISFVGSNALAQMLGTDGEGVFVTQVVPFPTDESLPIAASYLAALEEFDPGAEPGFVSFEGYLAGRLAILGLERCGRDVTRDCFVQNLLHAGEIDLDGFRLNYTGPDDNQGSDTVFLTVIGPDGQYHPIQTLREAAN